MRFEREDVLALFIDFQERLLPVMSRSEETLSQAIRLAQGLEILEVPHIVTQQYTKGLGMTVAPLTQALRDDKYFDKLNFSCLLDDTIRTAIAESNKKSIVIAGIEAHICVQQTVSDLLTAGYRVYVVADCVDSRKRTDWEWALLRMRAEGAVVGSCEALLYELTRCAGTERFKAISRLTK